MLNKVTWCEKCVIFLNEKNRNDVLLSCVRSYFELYIHTFLPHTSSTFGTEIRKASVARSKR